MTAKNTLEHRDERLEEAAEYASSARNNDWNKGNFGEDFRKELQAINGDAALVFDKQTDMAGFPPDKREEYLSAYAQGFNKLDFATHSDRRDAATGLAQNIYKPLFEKVELAEAGISQGAAAQLKQMGYDKAEKHTIIDGDGKLAEQTMIMARTEKDAEKIALLTGGEVLAQNRILDFHLTQQCDEFAAALYQGRLDPGAAGRRMNESFSRAMELIGSEQEYPEGRENEPRTVDFRWVGETRDEESRKRALDFLAGENWEDSLKALDELKKASGWEAYSAAKMASNALMEPYRKHMGNAVEYGSLATYRAAAEGMEEASASFAQAVSGNTGFIEEPGYADKPDLPDKFEDLQTSRGYLDRVGQVMEDHSAGMDVNIAIAARSIQGRMEGHWRKAEEIENSSSKLDPDREYRAMMRLALGMDYLITPKQ